MTGKFIVYGQKGSGSVAVEATLLLLGADYEVVERAPSERPEAGDLTEEAMALINPVQQVPALRLPGGELMTESAAILVHLAESHPASGLAPLPGDPLRPAFLRWMTYVSAQLYGLFWVTDDLSRLAADKAHEEVILQRVWERRAFCWRMMDAQVTPGRYILGDALSVLDIYVTVVSAWGPRRERFYKEAPKMAEVVRRVDDDPRLQAFWAERFR